MLFLQHLYNLSTPELEEQVNDRLNLLRLTSIGYTTTVLNLMTVRCFEKVPGYTEVIATKLSVKVASES